ncbi:hypothetical protein [Streptomyces sp. NPDC002386]
MTDWRRVAAVESAAGISSGYRITPHLVLTAGHGIPDPSSGGEVRVAFMLSPRQRWKATVLWHSRYGCREGDPLLPESECEHEPLAREAAKSLDLALLCVDAGTDDARKQAPVRWGRFVTSDPQEGVAVGFPELQRHQGYLDPCGVRGTIDPATGHWTQWFSLALPARPAAHSGDDWRGLSGAAVFVSGFFVGCVQTFDRTGFKVMPAARMLLHPCLRAWIKKDAAVPPAVEPADMRHLFTAPPSRPRTPAQLLDPEVEATPFQGTRELVDELAEWCRGTAAPGVRLLTGPVGVGKTRTAVELIRTLTLDPEVWVAGFLRRELPDATEWERIFAAAQNKLLLVVDRVETREEAEVGVLLDAAGRHGDRVRVLLLQRSADPGDWSHPMAVPPFEERGDTRDLYVASREALAHRLDALNTGREPGNAPDRLAVLSEGWTPAEVQLAALTDLLRERRLAHLAEDSRMVLLDMERQYVRSAVHRRLPRVDEDLLDLVLTSVALSGGRSESDSAKDVLEAVRFRYRHITGDHELEIDYRMVREVDAILAVLRSLYPPREAVHHGGLPDAVVAAQIVRARGGRRTRRFVSQLLDDRTLLSADYALDELHHLYPDAADGLPWPEEEPRGAQIHRWLEETFSDSADVDRGTIGLRESPHPDPAAHLESGKADPIENADFDRSDVHHIDGYGDHDPDIDDLGV